MIPKYGALSWGAVMSNEIAKIEKQLYELTTKLNELRKNHSGDEVPNYTFATLDGDVTLLELFGESDRLLVIHNMGQGCRYCTLWADGFNGFVSHLESAMPVVLVSRDAPELQRTFANSRGWRFRMASHGGGKYIEEQTVMKGGKNTPGVVVYERDGDRITRKNAAEFGPGDLFCSIWNLLGMAGISEADWTPQYNYWRRPEKMDDGGANLLE
jgi:predicted dithiol-disulfide oxidoreductase (DUF899 family)